MKNGKVMSRQDVFALIDGERDYQDYIQADWDDSSWSINDWVIFIERYIQQCKNHTGNRKDQMDSIRKIGALAIAAMEYNYTEKRIWKK